MNLNGLKLKYIETPEFSANLEFNSIRFEKYRSNPMDFKGKEALLFEFGADLFPNFLYRSGSINYNKRA